MIKPLTNDELSTALNTLTEWQVADGKLFRRLLFTDFIEAFEFMKRVAEVAEQNDHHPEWLNVYNRVDIWLTTHECGAISQRDLILANAIDCRVQR